MRDVIYLSAMNENDYVEQIIFFLFNRLFCMNLYPVSNVN